MKSTILFCLIVSLFSLSYSNENQNKESFTPWYTGPLLTPSASNLLPGQTNIQPYLFFTDTHSLYNSKHPHKKAKDTLSINQTNSIQRGLLKFLDVTLNFNFLYNHKENVDIFDYGDTSVCFGIQLLRQKDHTPIPDIRLCLTESFPTGKYKNLHPNKFLLDGSGTGAYTTEISLNFSKVVYWIKNHPISFRIVPYVSIPASVKVTNFNTYGGGYNTKGTVKPPVIYSPYFAFEFSFNQRWVYAMDIVYSYSTGASFSGTNGVQVDGSKALTGSDKSQLLTITPSIEYNLTENLGIITGFWFPIYSQNTDDFLSYVFSLTYTF